MLRVVFNESDSSLGKRLRQAALWGTLAIERLGRRGVKSRRLAALRRSALHTALEPATFTGVGGFGRSRALVCLPVLGAALAVAPAALSEEQQDPWPRAIIDQPSTLPVRAWSAAVGAQSNNDFTNVSLTFGGLWGLSYGFTNDFTAGISYDALVASTGDPIGTGPLLANAVYSVYHDDTLEVIVMGSAGYSFDQKDVAPLTLGVGTPWNVLP